MDDQSTKGIEVTVMLQNGEIVPMKFWRKACVGDLREALQKTVAQFEHVDLANIVISVNSTTELSGRDRLSQYQSRLLHPKIKTAHDDDFWRSILRDTCLAPLSSFLQSDSGST